MPLNLKTICPLLIWLFLTSPRKRRHYRSVYNKEVKVFEILVQLGSQKTELSEEANITPLPWLNKEFWLLKINLDAWTSRLFHAVYVENFKLKA